MPTPLRSLLHSSSSLLWCSVNHFCHRARTTFGTQYPSEGTSRQRCWRYAALYKCHHFGSFLRIDLDGQWVL